MAGTHTNPRPNEVNLKGRDGCDLCAEMRTAGYATCVAHEPEPVRDDWLARGHRSPYDAAFAHLGALDEALGDLLPAPLACVGSACVARLRDRLRPAVEAAALGADARPLDLLTALARGRKAVAA